MSSLGLENFSMDEVARGLRVMYIINDPGYAVDSSRYYILYTLVFTA